MTSQILPNSFLSLVLQGLDANLPAAANVLIPTGNTGYYYATDTNILYRWTGTAWDATMPKPVATGAAATARAIAGVTYRLDTAAGSVLTLPAATGSGAVINVLVTKTTTSGAHKVLTSPVTDVLIGNAAGSTVTSKAALIFSSAAATGNHSLQMPFAGSQPSGGFEGDSIVLTDIAAGTWFAEIVYQSGTTPTSPFNTGTT